MPRPLVHAIVSEAMATIELTAPMVLHGEWLSECEGFRVYEDDCSLGVVDEIIRDRDGHPLSLSVRYGTFVLHRKLVSLADVREVVPSKTTIVVSTVAARRPGHARHRRFLGRHALRHGA
jgi:hypothetical protein